MMSESILIAILAFIVIMCWDQRKWRKSFALNIRQSTDDYHDLFSQSTDHLAFIADCFDEQPNPIATPAVQGMPPMDIKSILTQTIMNRIGMGLEHGEERQSEERQISEETEHKTKETEDELD